MSRRALLVLLLAAPPVSADTSLPAMSSRTLLVNDVTLPGFSAGYHEVGYAVFDVPSGHYDSATFALSLGGARQISAGSPPADPAQILLEEVSAPNAAAFDYFAADWSGPFVGSLSVIPSPSAQVVTAALNGQGLLAYLDGGGEIGIAGMSRLGPDQPDPMQWLGGGSATLLLGSPAEAAKTTFIPEPSYGWLITALAVCTTVRPRTRRI